MQIMRLSLVGQIKDPLKWSVPPPLLRWMFKDRVRHNKRLYHYSFYELEAQQLPEQECWFCV